MKFTIIYTPTIDYHFMQQRPQRLMEQFARHGHQVYYMNQTQDIGKPMETVEPNLHIVHNHRDILSCQKDHKVVLWMSWAQTQNWINIIQPDLAVYDCIDDFAQWREAEATIVDKVDLVVTTAELLYDKMVNKHHNVVMAKNGCEYDHFENVDHYVTPSDWPLKPNERAVGYIGALGHWVDAELVLRIAREWPIVMIGAEFGMPQIVHPNIYRLGLRDYKTLPAYIKNMGALIIPFQLNDITRATNPIKMYEYLATGRPVITTAMPEAKLHPEVLACDDHIQFAAQLHRSMIGRYSSPAEVQARREVAKQNSWTSRYETIIEALENTANIKFIK